ncbi:MAG: membrane protein insertase YidC, partial [Deltaproteobacteria bacterium]|nr:membrane protein insertase YidC [Deltaproteobacteria bacterium]
MDKNALIAIVLSIAILILYQEWVSRYYDTPPEQTPPGQATPPRSTSPRPEGQARPLTPETPTQQTKRTQDVQRPQVPMKDLKVETDNYIAVFTNRGARLKSFLLKQHRNSIEADSAPFEMIASARGLPYPLGLQFNEPVPFNDQELVYVTQNSDLKLNGDSEGSILFQGTTPWGTTVTKKFTFNGSRYTLGLEITADGAGNPAPPDLLLTSAVNTQQAEIQDAVFEGLVALVGGKLVREYPDDLNEFQPLNGQINWAGFGYTYFLFALLPEAEPRGNLSVKKIGPGFQMDLGVQLPGESPPKVQYTLFVGPKDVDAMKALGRGLERSIDFGYFAFVAAPLLQILRFSHRFTGSYGMDIILLTILIKLLLAPLTHKSFVSMKQMQKLQPQMQRIRERYKDDKEKMNREIMELYKRNKVNPLGGCLPMLLQFPVFIGLYNALRTPIELRHASFLWIKDLSRPDYESLPFTLLGWKVGLPILVLLMGASMFIQQWMS